MVFVQDSRLQMLKRSICFLVPLQPPFRTVLSNITDQPKDAYQLVSSSLKQHTRHIVSSLWGLHWNKSIWYFLFRVTGETYMYWDKSNQK